LDDLAVHRAFVDGDIAEIRNLLGAPADFPNAPGPGWLGDILTYAIYWSPLETVRELLELGAEPNVDPGDGFPPLIAVTDRDPRDGLDLRGEIMRLLLEHGANPNVQGMNDGTPLHQIVWKREGWSAHMEAASILLEHGADPEVRTRIDDYSTPIEDAEAVGALDLAHLMRSHVAG
jgi:uncharacterized protein